MYKDDYARALEQAAKNVAEHTVQVVCAQRNDQGQFLAGIYRCMKPNGSSCYGFDIAISRFGIAIYGDIGELVFNVGTSYGTEFLARKSVDGYMIGKLVEAYRQDYVVDENKLRTCIIQAGAELITVKAAWPEDDDELPSEEPKWVEQLATGMLDNPLSKVDDLLDLMDKLKNHSDHCLFEDFTNAYSELWDEQVPNGIQAVECFLSDNYKALGLPQEWYEISYRRHSENLVEKLEMVRLMAHKIEEMERATD